MHSGFTINTFIHLSGLVIIINLIRHIKVLWSHQIVSLFLKQKMQANVWNLCLQGNCLKCI